MRGLLIILLTITTGCVRSFSVKGCRGSDVIIKCNYEEDRKHRDKFFCSRPKHKEHKERKKILKSERGDTWEHKGRFSLYDNRSFNYFNVIIRDLTDKDQTTNYWCGVDIPGYFHQDLYSEVKFQVLNDDCYGKPETKSAYVGGNISIECKHPASEEKKNKILCKEDKNHNCINLITDHGSIGTANGRFTLSKLRPGAHRVTISSLTGSDSGTYWCAMGAAEGEGSYIALLTEVHLHIATKTTIDLPEVPSYERSQLSLFLPAVICVTALLFVFIFMATVVLFVRRKHTGSHHNRQNTSHHESIDPRDRPGPELTSGSVGPASKATTTPHPRTPPPSSSELYTNIHPQSDINGPVSLGLAEHRYVDAPSELCQYQSLDLNLVEDHVYYSLDAATGHNRPVRI